MKLLTNYIPIKKANGQSNISEYETESSIQKNFSNKCQKNKNHLQAKSVQATHNNQISPKKNINKNMKEKMLIIIVIIVVDIIFILMKMTAL